MHRANRKAKLSRYIVTLKREVEFTAEIEVEARSAEEAQDTAANMADDARASFWREGDVTSESAKAKLVR